MAPSKRGSAAARKQAAKPKARAAPALASPPPNGQPASGQSAPNPAHQGNHATGASNGSRAAERAAQAGKRAAGAAANAAIDASRRAMEATPTIVLRAASIIEEEVAMGIGAAKRIEQRFLDVDALRAQQPDHVMQRFRKDAHEAIDIILDVVTAAAATVGDRAGRMVNVTASRMSQMQRGSDGASAPATKSGADSGATQLSTVRVPGMVAPGAKAEVVMSLENASDLATAQFTMHSSELMSASGARIPADHVIFAPATLAVGPRTSGSVTATVQVPADAPAGSYEGLVRATQLDGLRAMLLVQVG